MTTTNNHCCGEMAAHLAAGVLALEYSARFREYGIRILDGGTAVQLIGYCPWCGVRLPSSLRDAWFERLDDLGLEPDSPWIPDELKNDRWWKERPPSDG